VALHEQQPRIRAAVLEDSARIAELSAVLGYPVSSSTLVERLRRLLPRSEESILVAELASSSIVGWVHGSEQELLESGRRCEILGLVVDPLHRGKGIARKLVSHLEEWASSRGLDQIAVRSNVLRVESHPFYERLGYARSKTQHAYFKQLYPGSSSASI
jgi:GNAT superfamily N-acetyltransferase